MLAGLARLVTDVTDAFDHFDYARALERTETWFWAFCDDYLELVKSRAYAGDQSAAAALAIALDTVLRLFAPFLPFAAEEVWSWWRDGSIHRAAWPDGAALAAAAGDADPEVLAVASATLGAVRRAKSEAKQSMRSEVERVVVRDAPDRLAALGAAAEDVKAAGRVASLDLAEGDDPAVEVTLAG
jgi:valyl-tRNA synthetase